MSKTVRVLNGPNLNLLGSRETSIYGTKSLAEIIKEVDSCGKARGYQILHVQSNSEGELIDAVQKAKDDSCGIIINPGGLTHSSVALMDALLAVGLPTIEVHISNIYRREDFRSNSYVSKAADGVISGCGKLGIQVGLGCGNRACRGLLSVSAIALNKAPVS